MRICEFRSYEPRIADNRQCAVDMDEVVAVHDTQLGNDRLTAITLRDRDEKLLVLQTYELVVEYWKGKRNGL